MKALIQRVSSASVSIGGDCVAEIKTGLLVLLGVGESDTPRDVLWMVSKVANLRVFNDAEGKMNLSLADTGGDVLLVSQFTLYGDARKGNRPSFVQAARPEIAKPLYEMFLSELQKTLNKSIPTGVFGADMQVLLVNDGPVTIMIESP
jgi:D-tyrosyl-tRNA(Tyr) deacylase